MCWYTLSLSSALDVVGVQRHAPAALPTGMIRYPIVRYRRLGGTQGQSGRMRKISPLTRIHSPDRLARNHYGILTHIVKKKKITQEVLNTCVI